MHHTPAFLSLSGCPFNRILFSPLTQRNITATTTHHQCPLSLASNYSCSLFLFLERNGRYRTPRKYSAINGSLAGVGAWVTDSIQATTRSITCNLLRISWQTEDERRMDLSWKHDRVLQKQLQKKNGSVQVEWMIPEKTLSARRRSVQCRKRIKTSCFLKLLIVLSQVRCLFKIKIKIIFRSYE